MNDDSFGKAKFQDEIALKRNMLTLKNGKRLENANNLFCWYKNSAFFTCYNDDYNIEKAIDAFQFCKFIKPVFHFISSKS